MKTFINVLNGINPLTQMKLLSFSGESRLGDSIMSLGVAFNPTQRLSLQLRQISQLKNEPLSPSTTDLTGNVAGFEETLG